MKNAAVVHFISSKYYVAYGSWNTMKQYVDNDSLELEHYPTSEHSKNFLSEPVIYIYKLSHLSPTGRNNQIIDGSDTKYVNFSLVT